jgi:hypothetical protein
LPADGLRIDGFDTVTSVVALGNYLAVLSASGQRSTQVFAIEADGFASVRARASAPELAYLLAEIVGAIHHTLQPYGYLMAHAGQGVFICASNGPLPLDPEEVESEIQSLLDDAGCVFDNGDPMDIVIAVGQPIQPGLVKTLGTDALFHRVMSRARAKADARTDSPRRPNIRPVPNVR